MGGPLTTAAARARAALLAPLSRRARNELLFCLAGVPLGLIVAGVVVWVMAVALAVVVLSPPSRPPSIWLGVAAAALDVLGLLLAVVLATRVARRLGAVHRRLAARLLGTQVTPPPPLARAGAGCAGWPPGCGTVPAGGPSPTRWSSCPWPSARPTRSSGGRAGWST